MFRERLKVKGIEKIDLRRDVGGVIRATAKNEHDLYRALGYCHAHDRGMQMLMVRILGQGRACELLDDTEELLEVDRFFRRKNFAGGLSREVSALRVDVRELLNAYCDGANQAFKKKKPVEMTLLGYRPAPWTPEDCLLLARLSGYISLAQSQGDMERLIVEMIQAGLPEEHLEELFPGILGGLDVEMIQKISSSPVAVPDGVRWGGVLPRLMASNNWVISGDRSASGAPILSNDPHLEVNRLPAVWYEFVGELPGRYLISATMPGMPAFLLARGTHVAWGATYAFLDAEDSWVEHCENRKYKRIVNGEERWVAFRKRKEVIKRKKHPDLELTFWENHHGVLDGNPSRPGYYLATKWAGAQAGRKSMEGIVDAARARTVEECAAGLGKLELAFSWVVADREGDIGLQMSGAAPRRREGVSGAIPLPGWLPENDWKGLLSPQELPRLFNPECGYIATANEDLNHLCKTSPINLPMGSYRGDRIRELLSMRKDFTADDMRRMHMDVVSPQAALFMDILRPLLPDTPQGRLLRSWDLRYSLQSRGATLFEAFYEALSREVFGSVWGLEVQKFMTEGAVFADFYACFDRVLLSEESIWFGDRTREEIYRAAMEKAILEPIRPWGETRRVVMKNILLGGKLPQRAGFDFGPVALQGNRATIHQGQIYQSGGRTTTFVPSYRLVTDFSEDVAYTALAGGPSDRRLSRWYTSGVDGWLSGRLKTIEGWGAKKRRR